MLFSRSISTFKVIMKKSYYGELNRLTEVQKKHLTRDKVLPFGPQGTSQVIVRNEGCTSRRPETFALTRFHNCVPTQVQLQANKVFLMSCLIKNNLAGLREFCQPERTQLKETASSQFIKQEVSRSYTVTHHSSHIVWWQAEG